MLRRALVVFVLGFLVAGCGGGETGNTAIPAPAPATDYAQNVPQAVEVQPNASTTFGSSWGRIAPFQVFDAFSTTGTAMTNQQITTDAPRYPVVWGSFNPQPWRNANSKIFVSHYYVPPEDSYVISGHDINWWLANHPDWILYACDANNNPTKLYAYMPGIGYPDVPLAYYRSDVQNYQIRQSMVPYMLANDYNAIALDQINFNNVTVGGNPQLGQQQYAGYYGCGTYDANGNFVRHYTAKSDPQYATDMLNWIATLHSTFHSDPTISQYNFKILVNHTAYGSESDPNELALLSYIDLQLIEPGYVDYGYYVNLKSPAFYLNTYKWMTWVQSHNVAIGVIDKFDHDTAVTPDELEFSIATYLFSNEGAQFLYTAPDNGSGYGYGADQWHKEYLTKIGKPCGEMYGGSSYSSTSPNIYYRKFTNGIAFANLGGTVAQKAKLPAIAYSDLENRAFTRPIKVAPNDAWVLIAKQAGTGCQ